MNFNYFGLIFRKLRCTDSINRMGSKLEIQRHQVDPNQRSNEPIINFSFFFCMNFEAAIICGNDHYVLMAHQHPFHITVDWFMAAIAASP